LTTFVLQRSFLLLESPILWIESIVQEKIETVFSS